MSEGPKPMHPSIENHARHFHDGVHDHPGARHNLRDPLSQAAYEQGKRLREMGKNPGGGAPPKQTLGEAVYMAFALAGAAAGLLFGASLVGSGRATWITALVLTVVGFVGGLMVWGIMAWSFGRARNAVLWRRGSDERDAAALQDMWEARFGQPLAPRLLAAVADDGSAWTMDGKGTFQLRMESGKTFKVGLIQGSLRAETSGRGGKPLEDAYHLVLIHKSLGHESIRITEGSKNNQRCLWAAASLVGLEVKGYEPDGKAVRMLAELKREGREVLGVGEGGEPEPSADPSVGESA